MTVAGAACEVLLTHPQWSLWTLAFESRLRTTGRDWKSASFTEFDLGLAGFDILLTSDVCSSAMRAHAQSSHEITTRGTRVARA